MTREKAKEFLLNLSYSFGTTAVEYLNEMDGKKMREAIKALEQEPCEDCVSLNAIIRTLNTMDRYVSDELTLCDTDSKFPQNEVFIVDDVYELITEQLPFVTPKQKTGHWVKINPYPMEMHEYKCSECYHETDDNTENYCRECGARMVEQ
jgi:hypothetical protein